MATKTMKGLEGKSCEVTWFFRLENTNLRGHLIAADSFLLWGRRGAGTEISSLVNGDRTEGKSMKLCEERSRLDIKKSFSSKE